MVHVPVPGSFILTAIVMSTCALMPIATKGFDGGVPDVIFQFGALGLCAYMVFQNYRDRRSASVTYETQREELLAALYMKEQENKEQRERLEELYRMTLDTIRGKINSSKGE